MSEKKLGFGTMRLPLLADGVTIDEAQVETMTAYAIEHGINYFDTAYVYPGSESTLGEILERNQIRDKVYIATKLPHYLIKSRAEMDRQQMDKSGMESKMKESQKNKRVMQLSYTLTI